MSRWVKDEVIPLLNGGGYLEARTETKGRARVKKEKNCTECKTAFYDPGHRCIPCKDKIARGLIMPRPVFKGKRRHYWFEAQ